MLVVAPGCLRLNADFRFNSDPRPTTSGDLVSTPADSSDLSSATTSEQDATNTVSSQTETSSPDSASGVDKTTTQTGNGEEASNTPTNSDTASSTSANIQPRSMIEIDASQVTQELVSGYPVSITFDHGSLVQQGAAPDGTDFAVISDRNGVTTSLPRVLDSRSQWNQPDTKVWFTLDQAIQAGTNIQNTFYLVTQDPTVSPIDDPSQVFQDFEDFSNTSLSSNLWSDHRSTQGERNFSQNATSIVLTASPPNDYPLSYFTLRQRAKNYGPSIRVDAMTRLTNTGLLGTCGRSFPIALTSEGDNRIRAGFRSDVKNYAGLSYDEVQGINEVTTAPGPTPSTDNWQLHSIAWVGSRISYWQQEARILEVQGKGSVRRADQAKLQIEFSVGARSVDCTGSGQLGLEVDWYRVRKYTYPEPVARVENAFGIF